LDAAHNVEVITTYTNVSVLIYVCGNIGRRFYTSNMEILFKLYEILAVPALLYECENWTVQKHGRRVKSKN
jgi:hypothetical protein